MPNSNKPNVRDPHLWIQSALTVVGTAVLAMALHGALAAPAASGEPIPSPPTVVQSQTPSGAVSSYQGD